MHFNRGSGDLAHERGGHLRLARVLDADEQHCRLGLTTHWNNGLALGRDTEFGEQAADAFFDVVADRPDGVEGLAGGVGQRPFS